VTISTKALPEPRLRGARSVPPLAAPASCATLVTPPRSAASRARRGPRSSTYPPSIRVPLDVFQQAAHDLAAPRLRERVGEADRIGLRELADLLRDVLA